MNHERNKAIAPSLVKPKIPVVEQTGKGGLGVAELRKNPPEDVIVTAPLLSSVALGSTLVLFWDGVNVDSYILNEDQQATGLIIFNVPPGQILDAENSELVYEIFTPVGGNPVTSFPGYIRVNTKVPGNPALNSTEPINQALTPPGNIPTPITDAIAENGINVIIAPWLPATHMEVGDVLTLTWGQTKITLPPLTVADLNKPITVHVSKEVILATSNTLGLKVFYDIRDNVGNWSLMSPATSVDVEAGPNTLPAPRVQEALGDKDINLAELGVQNAHVDLPVYSGWTVGDQVKIYWFGTTQGGVEVNETDTYQMKDTDEGFVVTREIPNAAVVAIANGRAIIYYEVNGVRRSKRLAITVSGVVQKLPAPDVREQVGGVLDPASVPAAGATVVVKPYPGMSSADQIVIYWVGKTAGGDTTHFTGQQPGNDLSQEVIFRVPKVTQVDPLAGGTVDVYYTVISGTGTRDSATLPLSVRAVSPGLDLRKPRVPKAYGDGTRLNFDSAMYYDDYLSVIVNFTGMAIGQRVQLRWAGTVVYLSANQPVEFVGDMEFRIPRMEVVDVIGRSATMTYTVTLANGTVAGPSDALTLSVDTQTYDLIPPVISADNSIVTLRYTDMHAPHTGRIRWEGIVKHDTDEQDLDTRPEEFRIPINWVTENRGREVLINYTVYRGEGRHLIFSRVLRKTL
ncbi:hypothetical protein AUC61_02505 [Pseudomonas sp. S25]|uniref:Uncharacterized protein n=1 Tax=Pseudomonas maioricensis TaxID=1766623 RepID=A0ABS9ZEB4_9PSED|nr:hypothetical protein [Pseudomonas sp. S25]MCI8208396.1 hypothetical protein [Pseudomonas sp. S25]